MKRMMLTTLVLFWAALSLLAQEGLHVAPFYDGRFNKAKDVVSLNVKGSALKPYRLTLYRSLIFERDMPDVERAVLLDGKQAIDREVADMLRSCYALAMDTLKEHRDMLEGLSQLLIERETLSREEFLAFIEGKPLPEKAPAVLTAQTDENANENTEEEKADTEEEPLA